MKNKKIYFGTNLKMYKGNAETVNYLTALSHLAEQLPSHYDIELFVIPSYTTLKDATTLMASEHMRRKITIGAQNLNANDSGQFTGDISPLMLKEINTQLVMIGHSERRHIMKETDQEENEKVIAALKHGFTTLLCVGETLEQKNYAISDEILRMQLKIGLHGIQPHQLDKLWIAYEPVWAIGNNGVPASAEYADAKHAVIKQCLCELFGANGRDIPVLYGGSVNPENANKLIVKPHIDGLFVGRSAWDADKFYVLIRDALHTLSEGKTDAAPQACELTATAKQLIALLGGQDNIVALTHCATRLRVVLKNDGKMDKSGIEKLKAVKGLFSITDQYQIILGADIVHVVYAEMVKQMTAPQQAAH